MEKGRLGKNWVRLCRSIETTDDKKNALRNLKKVGLKEPGQSLWFFTCCKSSFQVMYEE